MQIKEFQSEENAGERIDKFLTEKVPELLKRGESPAGTIFSRWIHCRRSSPPVAPSRSVRPSGGSPPPGPPKSFPVPAAPTRRY